jgi:hypothetical protein
VGSNNNLGRNAENDAEYAARYAANLEWVAETYDEAGAEGSAAVVLALQANVFEDNTAIPSGFDDFVNAVEQETIAFGRPVLLLHGDSHYFRVDKPLVDGSGARIESFTRAESFGDRDIHWVQVSVDTGDPDVFWFEPEIVEANTLPHS